VRGEKQREGDIGPDHVKIRNIHNHYLQEQKRETFTGMGKHFLIHDSCATESMGPIVDRSKTHLGTSDIAVIATRKFLLQCVKAFDRGQEPKHIIRTPEQNDLRHVACVVTKMDAGMDPKQYLEKLLIEQKSATAGA
jgi:phthalate 4,5-dioxygenase oxygenase subunit